MSLRDEFKKFAKSRLIVPYRLDQFDGGVFEHSGAESDYQFYLAGYNAALEKAGDALESIAKEGE